jgi:hypothetical protein
MKNLKLFKIRTTSKQTSVQIQTVLLSLGYLWRSGDSWVKETYGNAGFLIQGKEFSGFDRIHDFERHRGVEVTLIEFRFPLINRIKYIV